MDAKRLLEVITIEQILVLMEDFGIDSKEGMSNGAIQFRTACHGGDSHKLYFYLDSKQFHCYTHCGTMNIIQLVQKLTGLDFYGAIRQICNRFGIPYDGFKEGFEDDEEPNLTSEEWKILNRIKADKRAEEPKEIKILDEKILNHFYDIYHKSFINDGISIKTMKKYGIKLDVYEWRIIIPHRDIDGNLIAVRCRNLENYLVESGRKYMPIAMENQILSAPTSQYLYGLDKNKDTIKRVKKVILLESEKAVMQLDTMLENGNFSVALSSSSLSNFQVEILKELGVEEVIVGLDKEYELYGSDEEKMYARKVRKSIINKLTNFFNVSVIWDRSNLLSLKQSPTDRGYEVFKELYDNRIFI